MNPTSVGPSSVSTSRDSTRAARDVAYLPQLLFAWTITRSAPWSPSGSPGSRAKPSTDRGAAPGFAGAASEPDHGSGARPERPGPAEPLQEPLRASLVQVRDGEHDEIEPHREVRQRRERPPDMRIFVAVRRLAEKRGHRIN